MGLRFKSLAERVRYRRKKLKMSQKKLGKAAGYSQQGITDIEGGENSERPTRLLELSRALLTTSEWLLDEEGPEVDPRAIPKDEIIDKLKACTNPTVWAAVDRLVSDDVAKTG